MHIVGELLKLSCLVKLVVLYFEPESDMTLLTMLHWRTFGRFGSLNGGKALSEGCWRGIGDQNITMYLVYVNELNCTQEGSL